MHTYSFMINAAISMRNFWIKSRIPFFSCPNDQKQHLCNECVKHINNLGGSFQEQQTKIGGRVYSVALVLRDIIWFLVPEITMDLCNCEWFLSVRCKRHEQIRQVDEVKVSCPTWKSENLCTKNVNSAAVKKLWILFVCVGAWVGVGGGLLTFSFWLFPPYWPVPYSP